MSKKITYWLLLPILLSLTIFADEKAKQINKGEQSESLDFIRFKEYDFNASLETDSAKYINDDGVEVELIGVVHIADKKYYQEFNEQFKKYDSLLYEMVGGDPDKPLTKEDLAANKKNPMRFFQLLIGGMMKLDFQLDHIDYTAKNFVHADMTMETFQERQKAKGENLFSLIEKSIEAQEKAGSENKQQFDFASMFKLSTTTCIIGLPLTSIIGFGKVYPACSNLEPAPAIGISTFILPPCHFGFISSSDSCIYFLILS